MTTIDTLKLEAEQTFEESELYFQNNKQQKYQAIIEETIKKVDALNLKDSNAANYVKALSYNFLTPYNAESEKLLQENVSRDGNDIDSLVLLGYVLYKNKKYEESKKSFETALEKSNRKNTRALRYLSIVMRLVGQGEERQKNVEDSIKVAKEALMINMKDAESWYILGNAVLSNFFVNQKTIEEIKYALKCYNNAEEHYGARKNPDLYYNRGNILKYLQDAAESVYNYEIADQIDPTLNCSVVINEIKNKYANINTLIKNNGNIKEKNLYNNVVRSIPANLNAKNKVLSEQYTILPLGSLKEGHNKNVVLTGKVTHIISAKGDIPAQFIACDMKGHFFCFCVYNITEDIYKQIQKYSDIFLADPYVKSTSIKRGDKDGVSGYKTVQIFEVNKFMVDYQKVTDSYSPYQVYNEPLNN